MDYNSQIGQDKFVDEFFNKEEGLTFVEFGALDGITHSNTYFLEKERKWNGLCIEPNPIHYKSLTDNRTCKCSNLGVASTEGILTFMSVEGYATGLSGFSDFFDDYNLKRISNDIKDHGGNVTNIPIKTKPLFDILTENQIEKVDYMSVDIEGGEIDALKDFDFKWFDVKVVSIENNKDSFDIREMMLDRGYYLKTKLEWDDIYVPLEFTEDSIKNKEALNLEIDREAKSIFESNVAARNRTFEEVRATVKQGKIAEFFLVENYSKLFMHSPLKYHDLMTCYGEYYEVKAYTGTSEHSPFVQNDLERLRNGGWNKSKWYILFNVTDGKYKFVKRIRIR